MTGRRGKAGKQDGFTIVELMITLLILGILVTIVVMTMAVSRKTAQKAACKENLRIIDSAVQLYRGDYDDKPPPDLDTLMDPPPREGLEDPPPYIRGSFNWMCPAGNYGELSGDYRENYNATTGQASCPRANHNP